jgi:hypothetical protein
MKKIKYSFFLVLAIVLTFNFIFSVNAQEIKNLLVNGNFEDGIVDPWTLYGNGKIEVVKDIKKAAIDEKIIEGDFCLHVTVAAKGANFWDTGIQHAKHVFEAGKVYTLSAYLKSAKGTLQINFKPELGVEPWTAYGDKAFVMTEKWKEFTTSTPVIPNNVNPATITFHIAYDVGEFWMDDVKFYEGKPQPKPEPVDLENGGFELGMTAPWTLYGNGSMEVVKQLTGAVVKEDLVEGKYALHVTVNGPGANFWDTGIQHAGHIFKAGKTYTLAAFLKSKEGPLQINFKPELAVDPWTAFGAKEFTMTDKWAEYFITTPPMPNDVDPACLTFHIGYTKGEFWMDGVRFYEGKYKEPDFKPTKAVQSRGKLSATWGDIKNR